MKKQLVMQSSKFTSLWKQIKCPLAGGGKQTINTKAKYFTNTYKTHKDKLIFPTDMCEIVF